MFLMELNENEKKNFLELAHYTMNTDGVASVDELQIFKNFRSEVGLSEQDYTIKNKEITKIITDFKASSKKKRKIVVFELFGIMLADDNFCKKEDELVNLLVEEWNLRSFEIKKMKRWVADFNDMLDEAYSFIEN